MKVAIPVAEGQLCMHFGHCEIFEVIDVDPETKTIKGKSSLKPPPHQPGVLPPFLADQGVTLVIAGGMGQRAINLFEERGIHVIVGAPAADPEKLVMSYLDGSLASGQNVCDH